MIQFFFKTSLMLTVTALFFSTSVLAQAPQKMSYQAVLRNTSDALVTNTNIGMQISVLQGSSSGLSVFVERHFPSTNSNGLVTIEIGSGTVVSGIFTNINWATGIYFIKTETDLNGGANYTISGTSQLLSVPHALYALNSGGNENSWNKTGNTSAANDFIGTTNDVDLDFIKQLNPVSYTRNNDINQKTEYGFIAQELEASLNQAGVTQNGIISKDDAGMYGVRYNDLLAPMVKAIQEQQKMIEELKAKVELLEARK